jgi:hypothetical protein
MLAVDEFYVIAVISNPIRYKSRWRLFKEFQQHMKDMGAQLLIVEQAFGRREPQVCMDHHHSDHDTTKIIDKNRNGIDDRYEDVNAVKFWQEPVPSHDPFHLVIRTNAELWHKENMINLGIQHLTKIRPKWKYVAWVDGDIIFQRRDIISETAHQLQHYDIVQMFSHVVDMGPEYQPINTYNGFMWSYMENDRYPPIGPGNGGYYQYKPGFWHPGFAWAATRDAMERLSLFDKGILGAGDHHMALCLIGQGKKSLPGSISKGYRDAVLSWEAQAQHEIKRNVGYVPGLITHNWHGSKKHRKYIERWSVITKNNFDPVKDLIRDNQGLYRLNMSYGNRSIRLRDDIRAYFRSRNEDSIDYYGE